MGLFWTFLGVGVISDVFMGGIEKVTSSKRRFRDTKTGKWRTHYVWNATVANLTLMALGSSAPEILLSLIEICFDDFFLGDLGAGTIVGSAAFNLLVISAVCIMAIPDNEVRKIKQTTVFYVTAFFSVFAYLWLMFILMVTSPDVTTLGEALITLLFCPLFVFLAYLADKGYCDRNAMNLSAEDRQKKERKCLPDDVTEDELVQVAEEIRKEHGAHLTDEQVAVMLQVQYLQKRSKAYYLRVGADQVIHGKRKNDSQQGHLEWLPFTADAVAEDKLQVGIGFGEQKYCVKEDCGCAKVRLIRCGYENVRACVRYKTVEGSAKIGSDFEHAEELVTFQPGETEKFIEIKIKDDAGAEESEEFYIFLEKPYCEKLDASSCQASLVGENKATVIIIDDDLPGLIRFKEEQVRFSTDRERTEMIRVVRYDGLRGEITCKWETEDHTAVAGQDYVKAEGMVTFGNDQTTYDIPVQVLNRKRPQSADFIVILKEASDNSGFDPNSDGGADKCICTVLLEGEERTDKGDAVAQMKLKLASVNNAMGNKKWGEQFYAALFEVGDEDSDEGPSAMDWFMHFVSMPWNLLFACVPPADYCGGWACFFGALAAIAVVTAIVGDLANLVGCCLGINAEITAITFVALGTSLPDTFASMAAATNDPDADASIGNITGSNSVNVFMGIGLSWLIAAVVWMAQWDGPTDEWYTRLAKYDSGVQKNIMDSAGCQPVAISVNKHGILCDRAVFMTPAGSIWFNLMVYVLNAIAAIGLLEKRRSYHGGELGGPKHGYLGQYFSAAFMLSQWFIYIIASSIYATIQSKESKDFSKFFFGS
jgi:solute carrier family 8 (sodium/calcium exchanger)